MLKQDRERELIYSFTTTSDKLPGINMDETEEGKFWYFGEIIVNTGKNFFTSNFENEFKNLIINL